MCHVFFFLSIFKKSNEKGQSEEPRRRCATESVCVLRAAHLVPLLRAARVSSSGFDSPEAARRRSRHVLSDE